MNKWIILLIFCLGCGTAPKQGGSCAGPTPTSMPSRMDFDAPEMLNIGNHDLKILVLGHIYDFFQPTTALKYQSQFIDFINAQNADIVVLGGDSIVGPQIDCAVDPNDPTDSLDAQWAALNAFKAQINARVIMVAGNHDGWSNFQDFKALAYYAFHSQNKVNYSITASVWGQNIGLHFIYTGDTLETPYIADRFQPILDAMASNDQNLVFGGMRDQGLGLMDVLNSSQNHFSYFSGDAWYHNQPISLDTVDAYNVVSYCGNNQFDADLITIGQNATTIDSLGNCYR